jgi:hypothetical protein
VAAAGVVGAAADAEVGKVHSPLHSIADGITKVVVGRGFHLIQLCSPWREQTLVGIGS